MAVVVALILCVATVGALIAPLRPRNWVRQTPFRRSVVRSTATDDVLTLLPTRTQVEGKRGKSNTTAPPPAAKARRDLKAFGRTNRVDGLMRWVQELTFFSANKTANASDADTPVRIAPSPALIVELAKELLYSGIPEQCVELYAAYCDLVVPAETQSNAETVTATNATVTVLADDPAAPPVAPNTQLVMCAARAFIALGDVTGALKLLQATSRAGLGFDGQSKSVLMSDLAECSPEGLHAALRLRTSMKVGTCSLAVSVSIRSPIFTPHLRPSSTTTPTPGPGET
jgi:hypothetical protein